MADIRREVRDCAKGAAERLNLSVYLVVRPPPLPVCIACLSWPLLPHLSFSHIPVNAIKNGNWDKVKIK
ncbi:NAD-glutamate dehydrogenase [Sesbania bispinosa]|nr:NAD-glutamate dehydrogenase [Sesbania bispinosa]